MDFLWAEHWRWSWFRARAEPQYIAPENSILRSRRAMTREMRTMGGLKSPQMATRVSASQGRGEGVPWGHTTHPPDGQACSGGQ